MEQRAAAINDRRGGLALGLYCIAALGLFAPALIGNWSRTFVGGGVDASFIMWALVWWPYALRHGLNPFWCRAVWAPAGFNLAWSGGVPLPAVAIAPLTALAGPVVSYNLLALSAPPLAAWCAFLICRKVSGAFWPALLGGYLLGFSPYVLGQLRDGHLNLLLIFPAPLMVLCVLRALEGSLSRRALATSVTALFVAQFLCSTELAASSVIFGVLGLLLAWRYGDDDARRSLARLAAPLAAASGASLILLAPYLYYLFAPGVPHGAINSPGAYSADLANLLIPTRTSLWGSFDAAQTIAQRFPGNLGERTAYLGLPLLTLIAHFGWTRWRTTAAARLLVALFAIILLCALGPRVRIAGWSGWGMPWKLAMHLPLLKNALPGRFTNYLFLIAALIATLWLADSALPRWSRGLMGLLIVVAALPNPDRGSWVAEAKVPEFFTEGLYRDVLHRDEIVITLPFGISGNTMLWQASARMYFRTASGYTGITPREFESWPIIRAFMTSTYLPDAPLHLSGFVFAHDASVVIVDDDHREFWAPLLNAIDSTPRHLGGVWIYRCYPGASISALPLERKADADRFFGLLTAASDYLASGADPAALTPFHAQQLGFLPPDWVRDRDVRTNNGLYLGPWPGGKIAVGVVGTYDALQPLIAEYRSHATQVFYPFPRELRGAPQGDTFMRLLVMVFDRASLDAAAADGEQARRLAHTQPERFVPQPRPR